MNTALVVLLLSLSVVLAVNKPFHFGFANDDAPILNVEHINYVNSQPDSSWKAGLNPRFEGMSIRDFKKLLGAKLNTPPELKLPLKEVQVPNDLPTEFDARVQWANCSTIGTIRDQGHCGSCWAFGCAESLSDRFCIQGKINVTLSPQDLTSCDEGSDGCDGGFPDQAWQYAKKTGIVTEPCYPYAMGTCQHPGCSEWPTPKCNKTCQDGSPMPSSKRYAESAYSISSNIDKIATEIFTNGPVEVSFNVYEDFATYQSGVYVHKTGQFLGGHAVKAIGWGVDQASGLKYWLIVNSWNESWGMKGLFMILRGVNECGIESGVVAGLAKV